MVTFPAFGITIQINKIAFNVCGITIYWYAVLIVLALSLAIILFKKKNGLYGIKYEDVLTIMLYAIPICFMCARLYYVIFAGNWKDILNFRQGGLAIYGGIIGGLITCIIYCKMKKICILDLTDYIAPALALRTGSRQMGKLYKHRGIWIRNKQLI